MSGLILAHDLGTTGDKATLVDETGEPVASITAAYPTDFGPGGLAEQDPLAWWGAVCTASAALLDRVPGSAADVAGVSFSGQMMGAVFLDSAGEPLRPAVIWADTRAVAQAAHLERELGLERFYRITGHRPNATYSLPKVMRVRDDEPEVFAQVRHIVLAKDYIAFRLTGELASDPSDASSTNAFDQVAGCWSDDILAAAAIPSGLWPQVVPSTTVIGAVTAQAARATGIPQGTPVVMGGGDGPMAAVGAGIVIPESGAYAYLGSSSWVSVATKEPLYDDEFRTMTFTHVVPGAFVPTATMQAGGASLQWIVDVLEPERGAASDRYAELLADAGRVQASADGLFFLPHLLGERSPYWNPRARAVFAGLARHHGREHLARAVLEGVAFNLLTSLQAFRTNGVSVARIDAIGGVAASSVALAVLSDVWGVPVSRLELADEATSVGAAVTGGVGVGLFDGFGLAAARVRRREEQAPDAANHARYVAAHELFLDAYRRLEPWFDRLP
ncbi:xylulokinase [Gryllotalpicola reticulitermitis]|uniref:Xylulose kinase n=1 Tax=Gryllotalpicola reticulitermitis TaxID=1184153 RepID=A0ABV8Q0Y5_9MICO